VSGRGLLSRIASGAPPVDEVDAIVEHLRVLLNTRQGEAICAPSYGVLDFTDVVHAMPGATQTLVRAIRATILEHEPRLRNVTVRPAGDEGDLVLRFEISGQLASQRSGRTLRFATTIRPGGRYDVST
jgi:type VI secretion system protein